MNKKDLEKLTEAVNLGEPIAVGDLVGIVGADKSLDRVLLINIVAQHIDRLGHPAGNGKTVFQQILDSVPNIVITLANAGYMTPDEIRSSPACNCHFKSMLAEIKQREARDEEIRRESLEAVERAREEAEAIAAKAREAVNAMGAGDATKASGSQGTAEAVEEK